MPSLVPIINNNDRLQIRVLGNVLRRIGSDTGALRVTWGAVTGAVWGHAAHKKFFI